MAQSRGPQKVIPMLFSGVPYYSYSSPCPKALFEL